MSTTEISRQLFPNLDELIAGDDEDDYVHICIDGTDRALCGVDMSGATWCTDDTGVDCVDCAYLYDPELHD